MWRYSDKLKNSMSNKGNELVHIDESLAGVLSHYFEDVEASSRGPLGGIAFMISFVTA